MRELTRAKAQSTPSSEGKDYDLTNDLHHFFPTFAVFAPSREIFRLLVAASPR